MFYSQVCIFETVKDELAQILVRANRIRIIFYIDKSEIKIYRDDLNRRKKLEQITNDT